MRIDFSMTNPSRTACRTAAAQAPSTTASRTAVVALAIGALLLMLYGERWTLEKRTAPSELAVATCFVDVVYGDPCRTCAPGERDNDKASEL